MKCKARIIKNLWKLKKWASSCPSNHDHKYSLVKAEFNRIRNRSKKNTVWLYDAGISSAKENGYQQNLALAYELKAKYFFKGNMKESGVDYMQKAIEAYKTWGANEKVDHLEMKLSRELNDDLA